MLTETVFTEEEIGLWRSEITLPAQGAYLNHAAVSPLPARVISAVERALREAAPGADAIWKERLGECERVRALAARFLGAPHPREVAFVPNTSTGLSYVAEGLRWHSGDNVVTAECEFPSNVYPWLGLASRQVEVRRVTEVDGRVPLEALEGVIDERTRVVAISSVQYATGFRIDLAALAEICHAFDALLVVDAVQSLGALPLSVTESGIDACVAAAHKWMMAGEGIGLLYLSERALDRVEPVIRGWLSVKDVFGPVSNPPNYADGAARFECGTANVAGIYALGAALAWQLEIGTERIGRRVLGLGRRLEEGLVGLGFAPAARRSPETASGIVAAARADVDSKVLCRQLAARDVQVSERRGLLRVSPHFYNTREEIDLCLDSISALV